MVAIMSCLAITAKAGQFDYDAAMEKATTEINGKKYIGAFNTIKEIGRNAFQNNNQYGKYIFYTATANLYHEQGDFVKAETQYRLAIGIAENDLPDIDASGTYLDMARCLDRQTDKKKRGRRVADKSTGEGQNRGKQGTTTRRIRQDALLGEKVWRLQTILQTSSPLFQQGD